MPNEEAFSFKLNDRDKFVTCSQSKHLDQDMYKEVIIIKENHTLWLFEDHIKL